MTHEGGCPLASTYTYVHAYPPDMCAHTPSTHNTWIFYLFAAEFQIEPRASTVPGLHSPTELHPYSTADEDFKVIILKLPQQTTCFSETSGKEETSQQKSRSLKDK